MKYNQIRAFEKHLSEASPDHFSNLYLVLSKEAFDRKSCTDKLFSHLLKDEKQKELAFKAYEADTLNAREVVAEIRTPNFFVKRQVFLIKNIDKLKANALKELEPCLESLIKGSYLILEGATLSSALTFYKKVEKAGIIVEIAAAEKAWEKERSIADWLQTTAAENGKQLKPDACQTLIRSLGTDKQLLHQEIQKLFCYVGERKEISVFDVSAICLSIPQETIWELGEAIFSGNAAIALSASKNLLAATDAIPLLRQIRNQFQTGYQIASILANGGGPEEIMQSFAYMKGNILTKNMQTAQRYGVERYKKGIVAIDNTEVALKNSAVDPEILLELLIIKLVPA